MLISRVALNQPNEQPTAADVSIGGPLDLILVVCERTMELQLRPLFLNLD